MVTHTAATNNIYQNKSKLWGHRSKQPPPPRVDLTTRNVVSRTNKQEFVNARNNRFDVYPLSRTDHGGGGETSKHQLCGQWSGNHFELQQILLWGAVGNCCRPPVSTTNELLSTLQKSLQATVICTAYTARCAFVYSLEVCKVTRSCTIVSQQFTREISPINMQLWLASTRSHK